MRGRSTRIAWGPAGGVRRRVPGRPAVVRQRQRPAGAGLLPGPGAGVHGLHGRRGGDRGPGHRRRNPPRAVRPTLKLQNEEVYLPNPVGLAGAPDPENGALEAVLLGVLAACMAASVVSVVLRFRRSEGVERQQLKWFTSAAALMLVVQLATMTVLPDGVAGDLLFGLSIALVPIAAGVAILRYRLYDIDRLINRTLIYAALTAVLGAVYAGLVLALGLLGGVGGELPSWAVAGATLAVAALFQPLRRRVQAAVDRRFNRRRYDAARTVEAFSARLRDQVDLDTLAAELLAGVEQTVQPTRASLWLRGAT